jgi:transmembrane 9 superfamily protein 2/4
MDRRQSSRSHELRHSRQKQEILRIGFQDGLRGRVAHQWQAQIFHQQPCYACYPIPRCAWQRWSTRQESDRRLRSLRQIDRGIQPRFRRPSTGCPRRAQWYGAYHGPQSNLELSYQPEEFDEGDEDATLTIPYTYSVYFREDEKLEWGNRWDLYFINQEESSKIHWLAIINSLVIFAALSAVVAVILARTVRGDIKGYVDAGMEEGKLRIGKRSKGLRSPRSPRKSFEKGGLLDQGDNDGMDDASSDDELPEDTTGWKLVHGDVFRAPAFGQLLAPLIGSGMQLVVMSIGLVILSCFGVLNPSFRGGFVSVGMALFILAGAFSGYFSARIYKTFNGTLWKHNAIVTATLVPGLLFATVFILNLFVWANASSTAIPLGTLIGLVCLWLLIQLPLVYVGSWYGFNRSGAYSHPIKANAIPRQIPYQPWYARPLQAALVAGLVPFAVIFIELLFLFRSLWQDKSGYYYVFGFLAVVSTILILAVMETTIIGVYIQLCSEVSSSLIQSNHPIEPNAN